MTKEQMARVMDSIFEACIVLRGQGQVEYAHDDNEAFSNFNRLGKLLNMPREKVLMVYFVKHLDGIAAYVNGHKSQREDVRGRIKDAIVYLCLLYGMVEENDALARGGPIKVLSQ